MNDNDVSLHHVSYLDTKTNQLHHISAQEAFEKFGHDAKNKKYFCELCAQKVTFAKGHKNRAHFRHLRKNKESENCLEKTHTFSNGINTLKISEKQLPLKITVRNDIDIQIGLTPLPESVLKQLSDKDEFQLGARSFSFEKISSDAVSFFHIGNHIAKHICWRCQIRLRNIGKRQ